MAKAGFQDVSLGPGVAAGGLPGNERLRFSRRNAQVEHQVFARQAVDAVLEIFDPIYESVTLGGVHASRLMREIRADVTVDEHDPALGERGAQVWPSLEAIAGVKRGGQSRIEAFDITEIAVEESPDHLSETRVVLWKSRRIGRETARGERSFEQVELRSFAATVDAFDGDELSRGCHHFESQCNRTGSVPQRRTC